MRKSFTKLSALSLCLCMLLAACGTGGTSGASDQAGSTVPAADGSASPSGGDTSILNEVGTYPIVNQPIEMSMFAMSAPNVVDLPTNDFTHYMEEKTGIKWTFQTALNDAAKEKINLLMASGDYPDAFMFWTPDIPQFGLKEKIVIPLDELIPENMPNYYGSFMAKNPELYNIQRQSDGHIYGIASFNECYHCNFFDKMWVNTMWLEKMGVEVPTTTEEFLAVSKKYMETNPGGVGITGSTSGWGGQFQDFLMGSFITDPGRRSTTADDKLLLSPDGKIVTLATQDQYREGLRYLNELYKTGAIYDGSFTQTNDQLKSLMNQPGEPVLFVSAGTISDLLDATVNPETYSHYRAIAPMKGPDGTQIATYFKYNSLQENKFVLTDKCKYPEAALRWADHFYTMEGYLSYQFGADEGTDWVLNPGGKGLNGKDSLYDIMNPWTSEPQNHDWQDTGLIYATADIRLGRKMEQEVDLGSPDGLEKLLYIETEEKMEPYAQKQGDFDVVPYKMKMTTEESDSIQTIGVELENYIKENRVAFITGAKSVDTDWDAYIAGFESIGLSTYLAANQAAWDRQQVG